MLCIRVDSFPEVQSEKRKFEPPHLLLAEIDGWYDSLGKPTCADLKEFLMSKEEGFLVQEQEQKKALSGDNKGNLWAVKHAAAHAHLLLVDSCLPTSLAHTHIHT